MDLRTWVQSHHLHQILKNLLVVLKTIHYYINEWLIFLRKGYINTDTYLDKLETTILEIGQDENGSYVIFDKTIFHPQGGGQPSDEDYL